MVIVSGTSGLRRAKHQKQTEPIYEFQRRVGTKGAFTDARS